MTEAKGTAVRVRTCVTREPDGWYCAVEFWPTEEGAGPADERILVGPFASEEAALAELRGDFREIVKGAARTFTEMRGGFVVDASTKVPTA